MPPRFHTPYICPRCILTLRTFTTSASLQLTPPSPPISGATNLRTRRLIALHGQDSTSFLHGITTANIRSSTNTGVYSAFLNAQGRVLNDVFIYPASHSQVYRAKLPEKLRLEDPAFFVEVDATQVDKLASHLKRFKLRAKVDVRIVEEGEWDVWNVWQAGTPWTAHTSASAEDGMIGCVDSRAPGMGRRIVLHSAKGGREALLGDLEESTVDAYTIRRMLKGVAEGHREIVPEGSLPHEYNIDLMGGIDFKKGCYVGQELTIRTQHTGVVRKRILPVILYKAGGSIPEKLDYDPESNILQPDVKNNIMAVDKAGRSRGRYVGGIGNIGLGLCRLEKMTDLVVTGDEAGFAVGDEFRIEGEEGRASKNPRVKAFVPDWVRNNIKAREPQKRVG